MRVVWVTPSPAVRLARGYLVRVGCSVAETGNTPTEGGVG
jgi:hypothetical protein